jgi:hypothetical protein
MYGRDYVKVIRFEHTNNVYRPSASTVFSVGTRVLI